MARSNKTIEQKYNTPFAANIRKLMDERAVTQDVLAKAIGKTRQTVSQYANGISEPSYEALIKIANFFNVSVDYLLGITDISSQNQSIRSTAEFTGLSQKAVEEIIEAKNSVWAVDLIPLNWLLSNGFFSLGGPLGNMNRMAANTVKLARFHDKWNNLSKDEAIKQANEVTKVRDDIDLMKFKADNAFRKLLDQYCYCLEDSNSEEYKQVVGIMSRGNH